MYSPIIILIPMKSYYLDGFEVNGTVGKSKFPKFSA